jgi:hypothetical protein
MKTNDASPATFHRFPRSQQALMPAIQNKSQTLVGNPKHSSGARDAAVGRFQGTLN